MGELVWVPLNKEALFFKALANIKNTDSLR